jgi:hypothetical protein
MFEFHSVQSGIIGEVADVFYYGRSGDK